MQNLIRKIFFVLLAGLLFITGCNSKQLGNESGVYVSVINGVYSNSKQLGNGSGVYVYGIDDAFRMSKNVYIGTVSTISSKTELIKLTYYSLEKSSVKVLVKEVFKGGFKINTENDDLVLSDYCRNFLKEGETYLFSTGADIQIPEFYPYEAVKLFEDGSIKIYNWHYDKYLADQQNRIKPPPKNLADIRDIFSKADDLPDLQVIPTLQVEDISKFPFNQIKIVRGTIKTAVYDNDPYMDYSSGKIAIITIGVLDSMPESDSKADIVVKLKDKNYAAGMDCFFFEYSGLPYLITKNDTGNWNFLISKWK